VDARTLNTVAPRAATPRLVPRVDGCALLKVERREGCDRLADLYMRDPLRVLFPRPCADEPFPAILATVSGGLVGGDRLSVEIEAGERATLQVVGQAAEKIYRSTGPDSRVSVSLKAGPGALLEMLPQGTILFDGARLDRRVNVDAAADATVLTGEIVSLGRAAMGESLTRGLLRDRWFVRRDGRLVWADALVLEDDIASVLRAPAGFAGATALGTAILSAPKPARSLELARSLLESRTGNVRSGASLVGDVLVARFLSADGAALRAAFGDFWRGLRAGACGLPERLPTIWRI
jgi:urease accessory protein